MARVLCMTEFLDKDPARPPASRSRSRSPPARSRSQSRSTSIRSMSRSFSRSSYSRSGLYLGHNYGSHYRGQCQGHYVGHLIQGQRFIWFTVWVAINEIKVIFVVILFKVKVSVERSPSSTPRTHFFVIGGGESQSFQRSSLTARRRVANPGRSQPVLHRVRGRPQPCPPPAVERVRRSGRQASPARRQCRPFSSLLRRRLRSPGHRERYS